MPLAFEQQEGESDKAFAAFSLYLGLGSERSIAEVSRRLHKSLPMLNNWSYKWQWTRRIEAHALHVAKVEREATEAMTTISAARWHKRREQHKEDEWAVRCELLEAGRKVLKRFIDEGKGATLGDVARALELASKLGRLSSGLATDSVEHSGEVNVNFRAEVAAAVRKVYGEPLEAEIVPARKELPDAGS